MSPVSFYFLKAATKKVTITHVTHITFLLDSVSLTERHSRGKSSLKGNRNRGT